jgi:hypothetical protein
MPQPAERAIEFPVLFVLPPATESVGKFKFCLSLCILSVLCVSVVSVSLGKFTLRGTKFTEVAQRLEFIATDSYAAYGPSVCRS